MSNNYFKYELQRGGGSAFTPENLTWFQRFLYRLRGYKVIKITDDYFDKYINDKKKTAVRLEIIY